MLQFEGGLSVTSVVLSGAAALAAKVGKPLPLTGEQAVKFGNYLLYRKSVQQPKVRSVTLNNMARFMVNRIQVGMGYEIA